MRISPFAFPLLCTALLVPSTGCTRVLNDGAAISITSTPAAPPVAEPEPVKVKLVEITKDAIVIHDKISFETGKSEIKESSFGLLDEIVKVLAENPRIKKVSVEGHTDDVGSERSNQKLSESRAAAVAEYLTSHGIDASRIDSAGRGEGTPLEAAETDSARAKNRRVEFIITEQEPAKETVEVDAETGEPKAAAQ